MGIGKVDSHTPQQQPNIGKAGAAPVAVQMGGLEASRNLENASDAIFSALPVGVEVGAGLAAVAQGQTLAPDANIAKALPILEDLEAKYLTAPPKGPLGESFALSQADVPKDQDGKYIKPDPTNAGDILPPADSVQDPSLGEAVDAASDKIWDKAFQKLATPTTPDGQAALALLQSPEGQKILQQLGPVLKQVEAAAGKKGDPKLSESDKKKAAAALEALKDKMGSDMDVTTLVMLVLMEIHRDRGQDVRDLVDEMRADNKKKADLRQQIRAYKKEIARVNSEISDRFHAGQADGSVARGTTLDDYSKTCKVAYPTQAGEDGTWAPPALLAAGYAGDGSELGVTMKAGSVDEMNQACGALQDKMDALSDITMERQQRLQMAMEPYNQTSAMMSNILKKQDETIGNMVQNLK